MGNCCKVARKESHSSKNTTNEKPEKTEKDAFRPTVESGTVNTEDHGHRPRRLKIQCENPSLK